MLWITSSSVESIPPRLPAATPVPVAFDPGLDRPAQFLAGNKRRRYLPFVALPPDVPTRPERPFTCPFCDQEYDSTQYDQCPHCALQRGYMLIPGAMQDLISAQHREVRRQRRGCILVALIALAVLIGLVIVIF